MTTSPDKTFPCSLVASARTSLADAVGWWNAGSSQPATVGRPGQGHAALIGAGQPAPNLVAAGIQQEQAARLTGPHAGRHGKQRFAGMVANRRPLSQLIRQPSADCFARLRLRPSP